MKIIQNRNKYFIFSSIIILMGLAFSIYNFSIGKGFFNYDVQFSGGASIEIELNKESKPEDIKKAIKTEIPKIILDTTKQTSPQIQEIANKNKWELFEFYNYF